MRRAKRTNNDNPAPSERICWQYRVYDEAPIKERVVWDGFWQTLVVQACRRADNDQAAPEPAPMSEKRQRKK